jgi:hypothetical protein
MRLERVKWHSSEELNEIVACVWLSIVIIIITIIIIIIISSSSSSSSISSPPCPERLWGPHSLLSNGYQGLLPWG